MTTDKNNAASDPQPAELADQQGDHVPDAILRCAIRAFERARKDYKLRLCNEEPQGKKEAIEALSMEAALQAAFALTATGTQQQAGEAHSDDVAVDAFAAAMKAKMADARAKGRGGWEDPAQCSSEDLSRMLRDHVEKGDPRDVANFCMMLHQRREAIAARQPGVQLAVWWGPMPESNGRQNWTAMLYRKGGDIFGSGSITIDRSEYPDRVRYEADRLRYLIGEIHEEPDILKYDANLHSGYVEPPAQGIDLGQLERIRNELHAMSGQVPDEWIDPIVELQQDVQKLIDGQRDAAPGVGNG